MAITNGIVSDTSGIFTPASTFPADTPLASVLDTPVQALYFSTAGDLVVKDSSGKSVDFFGIPAGAVIAIRPAAITSYSGTGSLSDIIILH
jgi:hypothetical protein